MGDLEIVAVRHSNDCCVGGSFTNIGGAFAHNNAPVSFTSPGSETITLLGDPFLNSFFDVRFNGTGDWIY